MNIKPKLRPFTNFKEGDVRSLTESKSQNNDFVNSFRNKRSQCGKYFLGITFTEISDQSDGDIKWWQRWLQNYPHIGKAIFPSTEGPLLPLICEISHTLIIL